jgi:hypothetical protein
VCNGATWALLDITRALPANPTRRRTSNDLSDFVAPVSIAPATILIDALLLRAQLSIELRTIFGG